MSASPRPDSSSNDHVLTEEGLLYARRLSVQPAGVPPRFVARRISPEDAPPWRMIVHGLEVGAFEMRERFEESLAAAGVDLRLQAWLGHLVLACFSGRYGYRRGGPAREGFEAWANALGLHLEMAALPVPPEPLGPRPLPTGGSLLAFSVEADHTPPGHDYLLFRLAGLSPSLNAAFFDEEAHEGVYRLRAWVSGRVFEASAAVDGERYDVPSVVGLLNSTMRALGADERFAVVDGVGVATQPLG